MSAKSESRITQAPTISTAADFAPITVLDGPYEGEVLTGRYLDGPVEGVHLFPDRAIVKGEHGSAVYTLRDGDEGLVGEFSHMGS